MSKYLKNRFENLFSDLSHAYNLPFEEKNANKLKQEQENQKEMEFFARALMTMLSFLEHEVIDENNIFNDLLKDINNAVDRKKFIFRVVDDNNVFYLNLAMKFRYELMYFSDFLSVINAEIFNQFKELETTNFLAVNVEYLNMFKDTPLLAQIFTIGSLSVLRDINNGFKIKGKKDNVPRRAEIFMAFYMKEMIKAGINIYTIGLPNEVIDIYEKYKKSNFNSFDYPSDQDKTTVKKN